MTEQQKADAVTTYLAAEADYHEAVTAFLAAGATYTAALASADVAEAIAPTLSCEKVTVIAHLLEKAGHHKEAELWLGWHSFNGEMDESDEHTDYWKDVTPWP